MSDKILNRLTLTKIHLMLAMIAFPLIITFITTGLLYTLGVKGSKIKALYALPAQEAPLSSCLTFDPKSLLKPYMAKHNLVLATKPTITITELETSYVWESSRAMVTLIHHLPSQEWQLEIKQAGLLAWFMKLHKGGGNVLFKFLTILAALSMVLIMLTGFYLAVLTKALHKTAWRSLIVGAVLFLIALLTNAS